VLPEVSPPPIRPVALVARTFGLLRSPESGLFGQGVRFVIAGGTVTLVYTATTLVLSRVVGLEFELALLLGFSLALCTHFTLQRFFVWVHHAEFALAFAPQVKRYLVAALLQYGVTAASTAILPRALHVATTWVYLSVVATLSVGMFFLMRHVIFHPEA
jgi:putative flippase GtrA